MRVLASFPHLDPTGGAERSFAMLAPMLIDRGVDLHIAVLTDGHGMVQALEQEGVVIHDLSDHPGIARSTLAMRGLVRSLRPDLLHASLFEAAAASQLASVGTRTPVLVTWANTNYVDARSSEPGQSERSVRRLRRVETLLARISRSHFHAVTPEVGRLNAAALGVRSDRVHVGGRGRDPGAFEFRQGSPGHRSGTGRPDGPVVLAVGRQDHQKGYPQLVEAVDRLRVDHPSLRLQIAGRDGSGTEQLHRSIAAMEHPEAVELLGQRSDIAELLAGADLIACASWREGAAGALIEAMAVGTPIVSVELEGLDGVLDDGRNSVVTPRGQLADGIGRVLDDPASAAERAAAARVDFERRFTLEASADRMFEIYGDVIGS